MFKKDSGKRKVGCPQEVGWASATEQNILDNIPESSNEIIKHSIIRPFHERVRKYITHREKTVNTCSLRKSRSAKRINDYYRRIRKYRKYTISSIVNKGSDNRPYIRISVANISYYALLDSGANRSVVGGDLAKTVQERLEFRRCIGNVKTADGQKQLVLGTIELEVQFQNSKIPFEFLVVPSICQDMICGYDFWKEFGLNISTACIDTVDVEHPDRIALDNEQSRRLKAVIDIFPNSEIEGLGCTDLIEHQIDTGDAKPIKQRYYPISPAVEKQLTGELDRMLSLGVIEEAPSSPWSSPVVVVIKPGKVRMCLDSRRLNSVTKKDAYPIPNIDGILSRLPPVHFISKIDLKDAFWQIRLSDDSKYKTAFTVPNRPLYQFTRMPFGLCNAPQSLCRLMDIVIPYNLKSHIFVYLDDLLVVSQHFEDHLGHLVEVACQLRKAGLTINVRKSSFALNKVKYLGYVVGNGTLQVDEDKVRAIKELPIPRSIKQVRRFLGMTGWYRRFIEGYSAITFPLTELLARKKTFVWTEEAQKAFDLLKEKMTSAPVLINPDYGKPFILQCDASTYGIGAVLAQADDEGNERPIAFMSHKLNKSQRNYTITELECLAVVTAIAKYRSYIEGHEFKVITDHSSLKWLMSQKDLSGRLARWSLKLQGFNFSIEHRKGRDNVVPDTLSRIHEGDSLVEAVELENLPAIDLNSRAFESYQYKKLREEYVSSKFPDFRVLDRFIYKRTCSSAEVLEDSDSWKLLVPEELRSKVIYASHDIPNAAHGGIGRTLERIRRYFYWPGLVKDVKTYIQNCEMCKTSKTPTTILRPPMGQMIKSDRPFQRLYIDLIGPLPRTKSGNIGILIILDHFSKFTFLRPVKKFATKPITDYLRSEIFNCFGVPEVIVTDNGSQFRSKDFANLMEKFGVKHSLTAVYSPQANASERVNRVINEALRSYVRDDQRGWDQYLSSVNCSLRNSHHQSVGRTPYEIVFGQTMVTHGRDYEVLRRLNLLAETDVHIERQDEFSLIRNSIREHMKKAYKKNERLYNLRSRAKGYEVGQEVVRRNFVQSSKVDSFNSKLAPVGKRATVIRKVGNVYYELQDFDSASKGIYHAKDIWT